MQCMRAFRKEAWRKGLSPGYKQRPWIFIPAIAGYMIGQSIFGNSNEANRLRSHRSAYKSELKRYKQENIDY